MFDLNRLVRSPYQHLDIASLLRQPVDVLLGLSPAAKKELKDQHMPCVAPPVVP